MQLVTQQGWLKRLGRRLTKGGAAVACLLAAVQMMNYSPPLQAAPGQASTVFPDADAKVAEQIKATLRKGRQAFEFEEVKETPIKGLYRVQIKHGPLLFTSADGQHFVAGGDMYGVEPGTFVNLKEREFQPERAQLMAAVDTKDQIVFSPKGKTKAYVNVFTDVDCGFCRKLHLEVPALNAKGVEVRYLAYPRAGLQGASYDKIATAWCADDPQTTLTRLKNREAVATKVCQNNPVAQHMELGAKVGVSGTPALVFADGTMIPGYQSAEDLVRLLGVE
ncbi:DsbC family protein [Exilibacterium tricleocarpae]|uniref:Thiol:disulfide interchange protein n=1 Tax=Exilibacterium tricleocarpae TaxID=2591008 RepID=A0A545TN93_9GAMM|nr:DsbC family protein [Exilibacterium tricleocarpae]TQV78684.1 DsbC family protein [Exilibacterium tricleocarpae]